MCKVFSINNLNNVSDFQLVTNVIKKHITKTNNDGFGMAVYSEKGLSSFKTVNYNINYEPTTFQTLKSVISVKDFEYIGSHDFESPKTAIFHGRTSTNKVGLKNAHPVILNNQCIVHNGVVSVNLKYKQQIDTDSELLTIIQSNLKHHLENHVTGYYAFLNILKNGDIQVVRDSIASLVMGYCPEIDSHLISTDESLLINIAKNLDWEVTSIYKVQDDIIFDIGPDNVLKNISKFKSLGYSKRHAKLAKTSLGKEIDTKENNPIFTEDLNQQYESTYKADLEKWAKDILLEEFTYADASWTFYQGSRMITLRDFEALTDEEKLECEVLNWAGETLSLEETMKELSKDIRSA